MIEIMNLRNEKPSKPYDFYIDHRSPVGNPFPMKSELYRDGVCNEYQVYFDKQLRSPNGIPILQYLEMLIHVYRQYGKLRLFCWCAPKRCHGETIKEYLENYWNVIAPHAVQGETTCQI